MIFLSFLAAQNGSIVKHHDLKTASRQPQQSQTFQNKKTFYIRKSILRNI